VLFYGKERFINRFLNSKFMPKYIQERERGPIPGAGYAVRTGLRRPKDTSPRENRFLGRPPLATAKTSLMYRPKHRQDANDQHRTTNTINPIAFIHKITPRVMAEFHEILGKPTQRMKLTKSERELFNLVNRIKKENLSFYSGESLYMWLGSREGNERMTEVVFYAGLRLLEKGNWCVAHEVFMNLMAAYLLHNEDMVVSDRIGNRAIGFARKIARAWVLAYATEYLELDLARFNVFKMSNRNAVTGGIVIGPYSAIDTLERIGEFQDLPLLRVIGSKCFEGSMEGYCSTASKRIKIRETLRLVLKDMGEVERIETGLKSNTLNDAQLSYHFSFLIDELGLAMILSKLPVLIQFGLGIHSPVAGSSETESLAELVRDGLNKKLEFSTVVSGDGYDSDGMGSAKTFLIENGFMVPTEDRYFVLTEKGKTFVRALMVKIAKMEIVLND